MPKILAEMRKGVSSVEALENATGEDSPAWWPAFMKEYISGNVYGVSPATILQNVRETRSIRSTADSLLTFTGDYPGLSAKLYRIDLEYADIDSASTLTFSVGKTSSEILLYTVRNGILEFLGKGTDITVTHIRDLTRSGYDLAAAVTCSDHTEDFAHTSSISLQISMRTPQIVKPPVLQYTRCYLYIHITTKVRYADNSEYTEDRGGQYTGQGSFKDGVFTAIWDTTFAETNTTMRYAGTLTVSVDPVTLVVGSFTLSYFSSLEDKRYGSVNTERISAAGSGIPLKKNQSDISGEIKGVEVGNFLSSYTQRQERSLIPRSNNDIIGLTPTTRNSITIKFY
jgi:hypothetical protein